MPRAGRVRPEASAIRSLFPERSNPATAQKSPTATVQFTPSSTTLAGSRNEVTVTPCISRTARLAGVSGTWGSIQKTK